MLARWGGEKSEARFRLRNGRKTADKLESPSSNRCAKRPAVRLGSVERAKLLRCGLAPLEPQFED